MKKFLVLAVFAWWFIAISHGGMGEPEGIATVGPFDSQEQCEERASFFKKLEDRYTAFSLTDCWETKKNQETKK